MKVTVEGGDKFYKFMDSLEGMRILPVQIGFFPTSRYPQEKGRPVAEIAVHHEFGAPNAKIPARPFMRPAIRKMNKELPDLVKKVAEQDLGNPSRFARQLPKLLGLRCGNLMQMNIALRQRPKLAESTLKRRRTRKINRTDSTKVLIDTGQMRLSVSYAVGDEQPKKVSQKGR